MQHLDPTDRLRFKTLDRVLACWEIIDPYWANFFVEKLLCECLSDSLQIWNGKRYFYGECFYRFRFFRFVFLAVRDLMSVAERRS